MNTQKYLLKIQRNPVKNYLFLSFTNLDLTRGLWMIYLKISGFSLTELGILEGTFHLTSFLMEVPTGMIADIWGRKISRIIGRLLFVISLLIMFLAKSFPLQLTGFVLCALNYNLESGAGDSLVYDSLKELKSENRFSKIAGYNNFIYSAGSIVSFIAGGILAVRLGYNWVFMPSIILAFGSILIASTFQEPMNTEEERTRLKKLHWFKALKEQTVKSLQVIKNDPPIAFTILFAELISMFIVSLFFYLQTFWKAAGWNEFSIGLVLAASAATCAAGGLLAGRIEKRLGLTNTLIVCPLLLIICLWGVAATSWAPLFYGLTGFVDGIMYVAISDYLNKRIPSERRATILSFQSMAFSLFMILIFPLIGWIGETAGLSVAFWMLAAVATVLFILYLISLKLREKRNQAAR